MTSERLYCAMTIALLPAYPSCPVNTDMSSN